MASFGIGPAPRKCGGKELEELFFSLFSLYKITSASLVLQA